MWPLNGKKREISNTRLEARALRAFGTGIDVTNDGNPATSLILASPHSGRQYPPPFCEMTKLSEQQLRIGEDAYIDQLINPLSKFGIPILTAKFPRCFVDVNRGPDELPPEYGPLHLTGKKPVSSRARAGLGVVPSRITHDLEIYKRPLSYIQAKNRIERLYRPYHAQLTHLLNSAQTRFGRALLIDCHSMPGRGPNGDKRADIILGDRFGKSCDNQITNDMERVFRSLGYSVVRNHPYAGGYVTHHYGNPDMGVDVIQIEFNKDLYLNPATLEPHEGMSLLKANFETAILHMLEIAQPAEDIAAQ